MSTFTNPAGQAAAAASQYVSELLKVLGDRDPFVSQEQLVPELEKAIHGLSSETMRKPERPGKWSIAQVIQHLADTEVVLAFRYRMVIAHDQPAITGFDQDLWTERLGYAGSDPAEALIELHVMRKANLRLLRSLDPDDFKRVGIHSERGPESLDLMMRLSAGHDLVHLRQIERIKKAVS